METGNHTLIKRIKWVFFGLYSSEKFYSRVNKSMRETNLEKFKDLGPFIFALQQILFHTRFQSSDVYRGINFNEKAKKNLSSGILRREIVPRQSFIKDFAAHQLLKEWL